MQQLLLVDALRGAVRIQLRPAAYLDPALLVTSEGQQRHSHVLRRPYTPLEVVHQTNEHEHRDKTLLQYCGTGGRVTNATNTGRNPTDPRDSRLPAVF
jgi:rhodanese-related sulfurtransferase